MDWVCWVIVSRTSSSETTRALKRVATSSRMASADATPMSVRINLEKELLEKIVVDQPALCFEEVSDIGTECLPRFR